MGKTVLVTGASGYVGSHVVPALARHGHTVIALDSKAPPSQEGVIGVQGDLSDFHDKIVAPHGAPDACLHLAWRNGFDHSHPSHVEGLPGHLEFLRQAAGAGVRQIAVLGTMHEVGYWEGEIDEHTPTNPQSLYGVAKNALRQAIHIEFAKRDICLQWLRAFYITGDDLKNKSLFSKIITWESEGRESFPFTSGKNQYDFIDVDDLALQIAATVSQTAVAGVINCCSGWPRPLKDQVEAFLRQSDFRIRPEYGAFPDRPYDSPAVWGSTAKIDAIMAARATPPAS